MHELEHREALACSGEPGDLVEVDFAVRQGKRRDGGKWREVGFVNQQEVVMQSGAIQPQGGQI